MRTWRSTYVTFGFALRPMLLPGARARGYERAFSDEWDEAPEPVREAAASLRYRDFLTVALVLDGEDLFPDN